MSASVTHSARSRRVTKHAMVGLALLVAIPGAAAMALAQPSRVEGGIPYVSPDGKRVAFFSTRGGAPQVWVMNADGSGARKLPTWRDPRHNGWAPDSRRLTLFRPDGDSAGIYTIDVETGAVQSVIREEKVRSVGWSPNGRRVAYTLGGATGLMLVAANIDGTDRRVLTTDSGRYFGAVWSPDGSAIVYTKLDAGIWTMRADGSGARQVVPEGSWPTWSPDGQWIAFVVTKMAPRQAGQQWAQPQRADIVVVRPDGTGRRVLTSQAEDLVVETPSWFPDGRTLAVQLIRDGVTSLHVLDLGGQLKRL